MRSTGLLIIDPQDGFHPNEALVHRIRQAADRYGHVVMTRFTNQPNSLYRTVLGWHGDGGPLSFQVSQAVILDEDGYWLTAQHLQILREMKCAEWHIC